LGSAGIGNGVTFANSLLSIVSVVFCFNAIDSEEFWLLLFLFLAPEIVRHFSERGRLAESNITNRRIDIIDIKIDRRFDIRPKIGIAKGNVDITNERSVGIANALGFLLCVLALLGALTKIDDLDNLFRCLAMVFSLPFMSRTVCLYIYSSYS